MFKNKINILLASFILLGSSFTAWGLDNQSNRDAMITDTVKQKIAADKSIANSNIDVQTDDGVVTLTGEVKTAQEADAATQAAQTVNGVTDVETSQLSVQNSTASLEDSLITAKILGVYIREKVFGDKAINLTSVKVETNHGEVTLTGTVDDQPQSVNAEQLAQNVKGVKKVINKLVIQQSSE